MIEVKIGYGTPNWLDYIQLISEEVGVCYSVPPHPYPPYFIIEDSDQLDKVISLAKDMELLVIWPDNELTLSAIKESLNAKDIRIC